MSKNTNHQKRSTKPRYIWQLAMMYEGINRFTIKCKSVPEALRECEDMLHRTIGKSKLETITIRRIIYNG